MKLNEHQSKLLFAKYNIPTPQGDLVQKDTLEDYTPSFSLPAVVKAQVLSGGRGKAGGIKIVHSSEELSMAARDILGMSIKDEPVPFVRIEPASHIDQEIYLSFTVIRSTGKYALTIGREGGVDIESSGPDNLMIMEIDPLLGLQDFHIRQGFFHIKPAKGLLAQWIELVKNLFKAVQENHLLLAEINPLVINSNNELVALDGKIEIDDNFVDLHKELNDYYNPEHYSPEEVSARQAGLSYHNLNGFVGLMVNGAGLAMATMDLLNFSNLPVANFLDLGGGADQERIGKALDILFHNQSATTIFINIFGGILSCEKVAGALAGALKGKTPPKPIIVRFSGFKAEEAMELIAGLKADNIFAVNELSLAVEELKKLNPDPVKDLQFNRIEFPVDASSMPSCQHDQLITFPLHKKSKVLVQGITGREGLMHTREMLGYGTNIVAGVTPFKGGTDALGIPVYNTVSSAVKEHDIEASIIFVPARFAVDAILEAAACSIPWIVCITEGIPQHDMIRILPVLKRSGSRLIGPNTPGLIIPGQTKIGIMPGSIFTPGSVAVLSRSGTLTYECVHRLTQENIGQRLCVGIGGDPFVGQDFNDICEYLYNDDQCKALLILGEIGGTAEEDLGRKLLESGFGRPVFGFIAGQTAPPGKRLGHAGAILDPAGGGIKSKLQAMHDSGITICPDLASIAPIIKKGADVCRV
ncbi:succinate--CoA ligase subunit alpha [Desulfonatronovibrio magnus]|uniref:succinate--CoA ligase subunit alpha n=1 Tax=Desulfonatronovibrio magnus TaxID=698827 RepID=UPI0005EB5AE9|nr:succinate--CoA ligase subunit alpha [Desulfonatronovibrio magnus]